MAGLSVLPKSLPWGAGLALSAFAVQAQDASRWSGAYVGASYSTGTADQIYSPIPFAFELDGEGPGIFIGYNHAIGPWVIGAELGYGEVAIGPSASFLGFDSFTDIKARAGYAINYVFLYGVLGKSFTIWNVSNTSFDGDGLLYGIGMDVLVSRRIFLGAEYTRRDITSEWNAAANTFDADTDVVTVRAAFKF